MSFKNYKNIQLKYHLIYLSMLFYGLFSLFFLAACVILMCFQCIHFSSRCCKNYSFNQEPLVNQVKLFRVIFNCFCISKLSYITNILYPLTRYIFPSFLVFVGCSWLFYMCIFQSFLVIFLICFSIFFFFMIRYGSMEVMLQFT